MTCINCNSELNSSYRFCPVCGNRVNIKRITVKNIIAEINAQFFNYDNKILKTFIHLITKPHLVIESFIIGARKRYVNVISYLAISLTLVGFQLLIMRKFMPETMESANTSSGLSPEVEESINQFGEYFFDYFGLITIMFIPVVALGTYVIFINKHHNYAEHIVLNIYGTAQYTIMMFFIALPMLFLGINPMITFTLVTIVSYLYLGYCYYKVYNLSILGATWRTIASQLIYMMFLGILTIIFTIIGIVIYKSIN